MKWLVGVCAAVGTIIAMALLAPPAQALQVGAVASDSGWASSVRAQIYEPSHFQNGTYSRAYWPATTFSDGIFFQAGYLDASNQYTDLCQTGFSTFVTGLDSAGNSVFYSLYNNGHCNLTGNHYFKLEITSVSGSTISWRWHLDGTAFGPTLNLPITINQFKKNQTGAISEIVDPNPINNSTPFATVRYNPTISFGNGSGGWTPAVHANFTESSDRICRYALKVLADNDIETGLDSVINPAHCHNFGDQLW